MRYLILSDIHGNWEALEAVLARAETSRFQSIVCCGDVVGYGADPDAVTEWVRGNVKAIIRGNHDKVCAGLDDMEWFNPVAQASAVWTQGVMKADNLGYLRDLIRGPERVNGFQILHGSPLDEDEYVVTEQDVAQVAPYLDCDVSFFGHTHLQGAFLCHRNGVKQLLAAQGEAERTIQLEPDANYMINPGSVGQPRDGDPRAAYAIYSSEEHTVEFCRVAYDIDRAAAKIRAAGLPDFLAARLSIGM